MEAYPKETYGIDGVLRVMYWNAGACSIAIVAKEGAVDDWAAYIGALPNRGLERCPLPDGSHPHEDDTCALCHGSGWRRTGEAGQAVTEEEVVRYTVRRGGKLTSTVASRLWPDLPAKAYRR